MNIFKLLGIKAAIDDIDLQMTPVDTYGLFECRGDMHRVRSKKERYYYFFIDKWNRFLSSAADLDGRDQPSRPGRFS
jgi:hypothetical protein